MFQFQTLSPAATEPIHTPHSALSHHPTMVRRDSTFLALTEDRPVLPPQALKQRRPSNFLVLAPVTSETYPTQPSFRRSSSFSISSKTELPEQAIESPVLSPTDGVVPVEPLAIKTRRSTSVSSTSSEGRRLRFLKLNPVHWGGEEGEDDYAIEE